MYHLILFSFFIILAGSARILPSGYGGGFGGLAGGYGGGYGGGGYPGMFGGLGGDMWEGLWGGKPEVTKRKVEEDVSVNCRVVERNRTDDGREVVGAGDCMSIKQLTTTSRYDGEMVTEMMGGACSWHEGSSQCLCPADKETCTSSGRSGCYLHTDSKTKVSTCISKAERFHNQLAGLLAKRGKKDFSMKIKYGASAGKGRLPYGLMGPRYIETGRHPYMQQQYGNGGYGVGGFGGYGGGFGGYGGGFGGYGGGFGGYGGGFGPFSSVGYGSIPYGYGGQSGAYGATHSFGGYQQTAFGAQPQGYPVSPQAYPSNPYGPTQPYTLDYQQSQTYSQAPSYQPPTSYQQPSTYSQAPPSYQPLTPDYQQPPTYSPAPSSYKSPTNLDYQQPPTYSQAPPPTYQQQPYQETSKPL